MTEKSFNEELTCKIKDFDENYRRVTERLRNAALSSGRKPEEITLLAATKTVPPEVINHAIAAGISAIGENRVQEYLSKYDSLTLAGVGRHLIGHLQTNKVKSIVDKVDMIESVDSVRLAEWIGEFCQKQDKTMDILLEVNIGKEENKSGFMPEAVEEAVEIIAGLPGISVKGLMAIPPVCDSEREIRHYFAQMRKLFIDIASKKIDNSNMVYLSMGMSHDFDFAILEGANLVRVGTGLFGRRVY